MLKISKAMLAHLIAAPIVAVVTVGAAWLAKHFPGLPAFNTEEIGAAGLIAGTSAATLALHYLKGLREWQKLEAEGVISTEGEAESALPPGSVPTPAQNTRALESLPDLEAPPALEGGAPGGADSQG